MTGIVQTLIGGFGAVAAAVTDAYFNLVTLLLPGNGTNGAQNNTFLDSSTNNFTITRNGSTTQGTFSPFSQTGWSGYFDGASDYIQYTNSDFSVSTGDFTAEWWMFITSDKSQVGIMTASTNSNLTIGYGSGTANARQPYVEWGGSGAYIGTMSNYMNTWVHICVMRSSGTVYTFQNGSLLSSASKSAAVGSTANMVIGTNAGDIAGQGVPGYLSNVRFAKAAIYSTSGFTAPTSPLTRTSQSATNVQFLTLQSNRFLDSDGVNTPASSPLAITRNGDTSIQPFSPFAPTAAYSAATNGGSGYFDGSGDYLVASGAALDTGAGTADVTFECWVYNNGYSGSQYGRGIFTFYKSTDYNNNRLMFRLDSASNKINCFLVVGGSLLFGTGGTNSTASATPSAWTHLALVRSSQTFKLYINGALDTTLPATTASLSGFDKFDIGRTQDGTVPEFNGNMAGFRYLKGTAQYTAAFTPPTAPPTAITNTQLLLNYTNAGITDATAKNDLETVADAQISTSASKWGGGSIKFDGTGDYLLIPSSNVNSPLFDFGSGNWTVEFWVNWTTAPSATTEFRLWWSSVRSTGVARLDLYVYNNIVYAGWSGTNVLDSGSLSWSTGQWYHMAFVRSGNSWAAFRDGTRIASATNSTALVSSPAKTIGENINGYIDDFRVTTGYARYDPTQTTVTIPTAAFPLS